MKRLSLNRQTLGYIAILGVSLAIAIASARTPLATQINDYAYDWLFRQHPPAPVAAHCMILAIDDDTYSAMGGVRAYRTMLARALELLQPANPRVVAIDVVLADQQDAAEDARLARAMQGIKNLVLVKHLTDGAWESPRPEFLAAATAVGHDKADDLSRDGVTRQIPLEQRTDRERNWAVALEAFRLARGQPAVIESPDDLQIGDEMIPAARTGDRNRPLRVLYSRQPVPRISLKALSDQPALASRFTGQVVLIGVTSITATYDRVATPYGEGRIPGVDVHAQLFETLERRHFLTDASNSAVLGYSALVCLCAGAIFVFLSGLPAYASAGALLIGSHAAPYLLFHRGIVFPYFTLVAAAWLTSAAAASYQHFVVRRQLRKSESDRKRYQQAIHFVTHEMRTPLTAIQGSSELMGRYNLTDDKRKQIADMINQESKRLARMIQTFLDVERLTDGEMELKREPFTIRQVVEACLVRVSPLADRKNITIRAEELDGGLEGDRELMEYALYNLLTNAVKYSGDGTRITVTCREQGNQSRLSVQDQGIGMDAKELKQIFQKFYRTKRAEASGETGTGIGLSIVEQIVHRHGGKMEVTSEPGKGSCFTVILPSYSRAPQPPTVSV